MIGSGIRPELGRVDYSPFLQGSAAGSAATGQGIARLGAGAGEFLGDINEAKKSKAGMLGFLKSAQGMVEDDNQKASIQGMIDQIETAPLREAAAIADQGKQFLGFLGEQMDRDLARQSIFFDQSMRGRAADLAEATFLRGIMESDRGFEAGLERERRQFRTDAEREEQRAKEAERGLDIRERAVGTQELMAQESLMRSMAPPLPDFDNVDALRKEASALPELKDFKKVDAAHKKVKAAASDPSAAGDLSLIFNYMKILDPGSTVREGEFATAQNAAGVPERVLNWYNRMVDGERLNESQREDFVKQARSAANSQFEQIRPTVGQLRRIAEERGFNPDDVVPPYFLNFEQDEAGGEELSDEDLLRQIQGQGIDPHPLLPPKGEIP